MDQGRDPVTGRPAAPPTDTTRGATDPDAIAGDIRETRAEMDETIGAIGRKLDPSHLVDEAKEMFTSSARDAGASMLDSVKDSSVIDTIKDNPLPAMAVGLSVAWFLSKVGESESDRYRHERYLATGDPYYAPRRPGYGRYVEDRYYAVEADRYRDYGRPYATDGDEASMADKAKGKASDLADTAKDKASGAVDSAKDKASGLADRAGDALSGTAGDARQRAEMAGRRMQRVERRAESWLDRQMRQNPLAVGAVALAAGALVGLSVPETDVEDQAMGGQARAARSGLASAASDASERVTRAAQDVADEAAEKTKEVGQEAEAKAKDVGDKAENRADKVADHAKADASSTT